MLAFQFDVHPTLMTVQVDMRRPQDINKAVIISFLGNSMTGIVILYFNYSLINNTIDYS